MCYIPYDGAHLLCGAGRFSFQFMSCDLGYTVGACGLPTAWWGTASLMNPFSFQMCKLRSPNDFLTRAVPPSQDGRDSLASHLQALQAPWTRTKQAWHCFQRALWELVPSCASTKLLCPYRAVFTYPTGTSVFGLIIPVHSSCFCKLVPIQKMPSTFSIVPIPLLQGRMAIRREADAG